MKDNLPSIHKTPRENAVAVLEERIQCQRWNIEYHRELGELDSETDAEKRWNEKEIEKARAIIEVLEHAKKHMEFWV